MPAEAAESPQFLAKNCISIQSRDPLQRVFSGFYFLLDGARFRAMLRDESLAKLSVQWSGPHQLNEVLRDFNRGGTAPDYNGEDYGLYQIYGTHILGGRDTLLYVGKAIQQTFSLRFCEHQDWLAQEDEITIYLGRIYDRERHLPGPTNDWPVWVRDLHIAECVLIYKYSPNYNSVAIADPPSLHPYRQVILAHSGRRHRLHKHDIAPDDWAANGAV